MADIENRIHILRQKFADVYGAPPQIIVRAPGRVNLIGEHTDYNYGYVLPIAIDREILIAASPTDDDSVTIHSLDFGGTSYFSLDDIKSDSENKWSNYPRGVAYLLQQRRRRFGGANMVMQGDVPLGSGLSSSAALEVATAMVFQALYGFEMSGPEMALLCQSAENEFVGVNCGIMDQFISRLGAKDHALFIDCRNLEYETVPLPSSGVKVVVGNTLKRRGLVDSEYNARRAQCEEAVYILSKYNSNIQALRDVTMADLKTYAQVIPPIVMKRAEFVVSENNRVLASVEALRRGDIALFGQLMNQAHDAARDLYEISCKELDTMVEAARKVRGVYGSRMTGAGFGGCTVSLVADEAVDEFLDRVSKEYEAATGVIPEMYVCTPESGAEVL